MAFKDTKGSDFVVVTSDNPRTEDPMAIIAEIEKGLKGAQYTIIPDRREAIRAASGADVVCTSTFGRTGGQRVVHAAQHLHGGMGVDRDYPLFRYFLWAKQLELTLGGATPQLALQVRNFALQVGNAPFQIAGRRGDRL